MSPPPRKSSTAPAWLSTVAPLSRMVLAGGAVAAAMLPPLGKVRAKTVQSLPSTVVP
jgi:hypothetical protein